MLVGRMVLLSYFLDLWESVDCMHFLTLSVMFNTALGLADSARTVTGYTASNLYRFKHVQLTQRMLPSVHDL